MIIVQILTVVIVEDYLGIWNQLSPNWDNGGFLVCNRVSENKFGMKWIKAIETTNEILYTFNGVSISCDIKPSLTGKYTHGMITWNDGSELYANWVRRGL